MKGAFQVLCRGDVRRTQKPDKPLPATLPNPFDKNSIPTIILTTSTDMPTQATCHPTMLVFQGYGQVFQGLQGKTQNNFPESNNRY